MYAQNPTLKLSERDEQDVFDTNKRDMGNYFVSAIGGTLSKLLGRLDTTQFVQKRNRYEPGVARSTYADISRTLIDDSLTQTHTIPSTGLSQRSAPPPPESLNERKETASLVKAGTFSSQPIQTADIHYNGHRH